MFYVLGANIVRNECLNIMAKNAAAWDKAELLTIETSSYEVPWNYGNFSIEKGFSDGDSFPGERRPDYASAVPLDDDPHIGMMRTVDLLKIDAEGSEARVIEGATRLIDAFKPIIFVEACGGTSFVR